MVRKNYQHLINHWEGRQVDNKKQQLITSIQSKLSTLVKENEELKGQIEKGSVSRKHTIAIGLEDVIDSKGIITQLEGLLTEIKNTHSFNQETQEEFRQELKQILQDQMNNNVDSSANIGNLLTDNSEKKEVRHKEHMQSLKDMKSSFDNMKQPTAEELREAFVSATKETDNLTLIVDKNKDKNTYIGYAEPGTKESEEKWRIKCITVEGRMTQSLFADGDTEFDNSWEDRTKLEYA